MILNLYGGPGGWCVAADRLGLAPNVAIELDKAACETRRAAGHRTIRADVSSFPTEALSGRVTGLVASPVCTTFSAAGKRAGVAVTDVLDASIRDLLEGGKTRAAHRREMASMLTRAWWPGPKLTRAERSAAIWKAVRSASLVAEPARFIHACRPEWVAMEQVPAVLPLWQAYAEELRKLGYSAWAGVLNSADYGVPQTRMRAILIASRTRVVRRPDPTHYDPRKGDQLFGSPWVSMAEALGWGASERPGPAVTAGGTATGGAEPFPTRSRNLLETERDAGRWVHTNSGNGNAHDYERDTAEPSPSVVPRIDRWTLRRQVGASLAETRRAHPLSEPAPAITGGGSAAGSGNGAGLMWVRERPSTTVLGEPRIGRPGHKGRERGGESHFAVDSVRITPTEAAILQSFDAGYPWQGTKTKVFEQIGNAWCPLAAIAVLGAATGIEWQPVAEVYAKTLYAREAAA